MLAHIGRGVTRSSPCTDTQSRQRSVMSQGTWSKLKARHGADAPQRPDTTRECGLSVTEPDAEGLDASRSGADKPWPGTAPSAARWRSCAEAPSPPPSPTRLNYQNCPSRCSVAPGGRGCVSRWQRGEVTFGFPAAELGNHRR